MKLDLTRRILTLIESSDIPISTPELVAITVTGLSHPRQRVWAVLTILRNSGLVKGELRKIVGDKYRRFETLWSKP